ncbi:cysteine--1-D-myo-inosityl 2-amino-2-deoxy-alpha-D-glucopyranoside ligase [Sanguibacter sp. HDW7]|uniref:cysteine--1-D-myo-inosityl 2-amino-2-deoxy-alpha-D-glucopyranoside ligase n=1 Tax=Sanguibacter sp. HDW7 TaxID=2714931 RepID=UPI00140803D1|nr:cysteine--1-D-myo-inosityl 2-amino-2-deoxy-alpha-D-glucopyranoside ligase [Sanguibacter sp. HDW7]QIK83421.1 cysteine--1-D-myo-inosityl 2-amino-2-deoxy-alpha-D-glucopyranoside ligase [Sanguibacter sp. HDW7]
MHAWPTPYIPALPTTPGASTPPTFLDTGSGDRVQPVDGPDAGLYVCGITPYDATHIGHAATYVTFDVLLRTWRDAGLRTRLVSNVTDVDDPLLERATATGVDWRDLAAEQIELFGRDMTALGVLPPDLYLGVVETVPQVAEAVEAMLASGAAYRVPVDPAEGVVDGDELGDVYADLSHDDAFGTVAHLVRAQQLDLFAERGGDPGRAGKRDPLDPLLWRRERPGEPAWEAGSLGRGRPGWHVECAVISRKGLGDRIHVQGGGSDLLFPHHEMTSSHVRMLGGQAAVVNVHAALVSYEGEKMSKSLGNLVLVSRLVEQGVSPMAVRVALLAHHHGAEWEWFDADLAAATTRLERWREAVSGNGGPDATDMLVEIRAALRDDLDTPRALAAVDAWAERAVTESALSDVEVVEGAPGVVARTLDALLGVRI